MRAAITFCTFVYLATGHRVHQFQVEHLISLREHHNGTESANASMLPGHVSEEVLEATIDFSRKIAIHRNIHECLKQAYAEESANVGAQLASLEEYEMKLMLFEQKKRSWFSILYATLKRLWKGKDYVANLHEQMATAITGSLADLNGFLRLTVKAYDATRTTCKREAEEKLQKLVEMFQAELNGCSGDCSKLSKIGEAVNLGSCRETRPKVCPEGTHCTCVMETDARKASVAFGVTYASIWAFWIAIFGFLQGSATPGPTEGAVFAVFIFAQSAKGCGCKPTQCVWHERSNVCAPMYIHGSKNPAQSVLPALGTKCVRNQDIGAVSRFFGVTGKCVLEPCTREDERVWGRQGTDTLNCQVSLSDESFPSIEDRTAKYKKKWPVHFGLRTYRDGFIANKNGDHAEALKLFLQSAEEFPADDVQRWMPVVAAGNMFFKLGSLAEAREIYERILSEAGKITDKLAKTKIRKYENMAQFKLKLINEGKTYAIAEYDAEQKEQDEKADMETREIVYKEGLEMNKEGDTEGALEMFLEAIKIKPAGHILMSAGNMYLKLGNLQGAEDMFQRVRKTQNDKMQYVYTKAHRDMAFKKMEEVWAEKKKRR